MTALTGLEDGPSRSCSGDAGAAEADLPVGGVSRVTSGLQFQGITGKLRWVTFARREMKHSMRRGGHVCAGDLVNEREAGRGECPGRARPKETLAAEARLAGVGAGADILEGQTPPRHVVSQKKVSY